MKLSDYPRQDLVSLLSGEGAFLRLGPFVLRVKSDIPHLADHLRSLYGHHELTFDEPGESSVRVRASRNRRRPWVPEAWLLIDEQPMFYPLHRRLAVPMLEWGMNWVIASRAHHYLLVHAATVERRGRVAILPASSGSGKSTLCSLLLRAGWRLFSDEFAVIRLDDGMVIPMPRAVSLKNQSIAIAKQIFPDGNFTVDFTDTPKGTMSFMGAPVDAVERAHVPAPAAMLVFPRYDAAVTMRPEPLIRAQAHANLVANSMNYEAIGEAGFTCVADLVERAQSWDLTYSDNVAVVDWFETAIERP